MRRKTRICEPFQKLKGRMVEKGYSQEKLSSELNIALVTLNRKLNGVANFQWEELQKLIYLLEIKDDEIAEYFFADMLRKRNRIA